ncbi:MAG TPA: MBL fold metallo-hydrolase [bacterium]|nr:MBL fold metallo-hydrolase [bacterium]HQL61381.1 MBL fold metallo-hydrolase [bacterium]
MVDTLERLSDHLYRFHDTCDVYVIVFENRALCIDFGAGDVLKELGALGVSHLDWVLHTHHHRDQCQGDHLARKHGARLAVPRYERFLFDEAENFWRNRRLYDVYNVRNTYFTLTQNIPVDADLADYEKFSWNGIEFTILPTPGHTYGSISLIAQIDGKRVAFTGDLIASPGKVQTLYDLQFNYGGFDGVNHAILSLSNLQKENCEILCPSHGVIIRDVDAAIDWTVRKLSEFYEFNTGAAPATRNQYVEVLPGIYGSYSTCSSHYAIISKSGKALFVDYGSAGWEFLQPHILHDGEGQRFIRHTVDDLRDRYGMTSIDVVIPSHYHDDHICGFPYLQRHENTQIWCYENMVEVLERPYGLNIGCLIHDPLHVDRSIADGEHVKWEEFDLTVYYAPGHADYHMVMLVEHCGKRVAFTGDNMFPDEKFGLQHSLIYRNHVHKDSHLFMARRLLDFQPEIICPGHRSHFDVSPEQLKGFVDRTAELRRHFISLVHDPVTDHGVDIDWVSLYPFQPQAQPGESFELTCRVTNYTDEKYEVEARPILPAGWRVSSKVMQFVVPAQKKGEASTTVSIPKKKNGLPKVAITADITINGHHLGQLAHCVVNLKGSGQAL